MKIKRFIAKNINGYLDFDLRFNDDLTFITGINGTGKTSALNSIIALIFPRLDYLATTTFKVMKLHIELEKKKYILAAKKSSDETILTCSAFKDTQLSVSKFEAPDEVPNARVREFERDHYKKILAQNIENPIIKFIEDLPSPMYLGLERRSLSISTERADYYYPSIHRRKHHRNIFSRSIGQSLDEALIFAQRTFQDNRRREVRLDETIRKKLVLGLLDFDPIEFLGSTKEPTKRELHSIEEARKNLSKLPELLKVSEEVISKRVTPLLDFLDNRRKILEQKLPENLKEDDARLNDRIFAQVEWSFNKTHLSKINFLSKIVSDYNMESEEISRRSDEFLHSTNSFLRDSGKTISFNGFGDLVFRLNTDPEQYERDLRTLSSGEVQLVVILTHLYFNPEVEKANVFIIDEPELSLHVQWQEKFVGSLMNASPGTQFILATHSPSIILNRVSQCIEIAVKR